MQRIERILIAVLLIALAWVWNANAGTEPAGPTTAPAATNSYTIEDIYNRLNAGTAGSQSAFTEPSVAAGTGTMHTLNEIYDLIGERAGVPKTGVTKCYDASNAEATCPVADRPGQDADFQKGVALPTPRFTDNNDGTVTDNLTGLIWLKNASCAGATRNWETALSDVAQLNADGTMNSNNCGDTSNSGSHQTDWRLPNVRELQSLIHYGYANPALSNAAGTGQWTEGDPFSAVLSSLYWSSSTYAIITTDGWNVHLNDGLVLPVGKSRDRSVWPVRGGQ